MLRRLADSGIQSSFANRLRAKRFRQFEALVAPLLKPLRILDVGGENAFWENRGWAGRTDIQIFSLNLVPEEQRHENVRPIAGDATNLAQFGDGSFDVVFSNSVIEHLFTFDNQRRMASEIQRVGKAFWVQTQTSGFRWNRISTYLGGNGCRLMSVYQCCNAGDADGEDPARIRPKPESLSKNFGC